MKKWIIATALLLQILLPNVFADDILHQYTPTGYTNEQIDSASSTYSVSTGVTRTFTASGTLGSIQLLLTQNNYGNPVTVYVCKGETDSCEDSSQNANRIYTSDSFPISSFGFSYTGRNETLTLPLPLALLSGQNYSVKIVGSGVYWWTAPGTSNPFDVLRKTVITLGWPLEESAGRTATSAFGVDWNDSYCNDGTNNLIKKHNGTDFSASVGKDVYAAEAGTLKEIRDGTGDGWAYAIVLEHEHPDGWNYTTTYWHVTPVDGLEEFIGPISKGQHIGDVADIDGGHLHFGLRIGAYDTAVFDNANYAGTGALPQTACIVNGILRPPFVSGFIDTYETDYVQYQ